VRLSKELLWGGIISCILIALVIVAGLPKQNQYSVSWDTWSTLLVGTVGIVGFAIASYRSLWKRPSFWILLTGLLVLQFCTIVFISKVVVPQMGKLQANIYYGIASGVVFGVFALIVWRIYRVSPNTSYL
jgi:hypothetical protein